MLQFTTQEMAAIRQKASHSLLEQIIDDNKVVLTSDTLVPPDARATWNLYYFCPEHGVRLIWDRNKPTEHVCPADGAILTGEPYNGAWWRGLNGLNAKACNDLGLLWQITQEKQYLNKVKEILLGYAEFYPDYEEHGGIPYNGPGKANSQTLCEANCNIDFARGYDFIKEQLTSSEQYYIEQRLLKEGAEFLMRHRSDQLHNHEMKISATIGVIGLILNEQGFIDFAVNTQYGLKYQLEHGVKGEGLWFEGSIHYHYYALQALLNFEKMACKTEHSLLLHPNFYRMLAFPLKLLSNTGDFPRLNDCIAGQEKLSHNHLFEFAYREFKDPLFASALKNIYLNSDRNNIEALLYGADFLPDAEQLRCHSIHAEQTGITIMHESSNENMLLVKHSTYGGEHDHYDRLGLIICRNGKEILPDLGTTGYGAELHYGYYKNTLTHNTLAVEQGNQPPSKPSVNHFKKQAEFTWLDVQTDWCGKLPIVDSHTIVQWDEDAYRDIYFRRQILWLGDVAIEFNHINNPHLKALDLIWHIRGVHSGLNKENECDNPMLGALARMTGTHSKTIHQHHLLTYEIEGQESFKQQLFVDHEVELLSGYAPDNPAVSDLAYSIVRSHQETLKVAMVHNLSADLALSVANLVWRENGVSLQITRHNKIQSIDISYADAQVIFS
ncbi:alginate lyase [Psychromonas sp. RZ22]|uniref:heparinase II/III domain-containing protein n=1 Tax=Psychromonas algarum TaxID=2555643 RepID=UPI00106753BE|nr:heparinase II/III family protein [Psychromonas sp. RZ22]TEW54663.1 alginate lyase [Psychromonas sp. RZ22]